MFRKQEENCVTIENLPADAQTRDERLVLTVYLFQQPSEQLALAVTFLTCIS
jgi:hypothetical protein